jgi:error-prone DNA polymerase
VHRAAELGYSAVAVTDECSVAGIVRAHVAAKETGIKLLIGSEFTLADGLKLVLLAMDIGGYERMCELITKGRRAADKGEYRLSREDVTETEGLIALWIPVIGSRVNGFAIDFPVRPTLPSSCTAMATTSGAWPSWKRSPRSSA